MLARWRRADSRRYPTTYAAPTARSGSRMSGSSCQAISAVGSKCSEEIEGGVEREPDDVYEMPVQHSSLDREMARGREVSHQGAYEHANHGDDAAGDVEPVQHR